MLQRLRSQSSLPRIDHLPGDDQAEASVCPTFANDDGAPEIRIGVKSFQCIGAPPPLDHPHVYLTMGEQATSILCPYCTTRFRFDGGLDRFQAEPPGSLISAGTDLGPQDIESLSHCLRQIRSPSGRICR
jgi:uncharacterized Zn-finger protein